MNFCLDKKWLSRMILESHNNFECKNIWKLRCLEEDRLMQLPKQKHTAKRIYDRLVAEKGFKGGESTIRNAVKALRNEATVK